MTKLERIHKTKLPVIIETDKGAEEIVVDLAKLSDEELSQYIFDVPEAVEEIVYRELTKEVALQAAEDNNNS